MVLGHYTSHMTGYVSQLADNIALQNMRPALESTVAIALFISGAAFSAYLINWARDHNRKRQYALPVAVQGCLFLCLAAVGALAGTSAAANQISLGLLCFIMGLQNATITKISGARIRTTHTTGMITDVGIEFGKAFYQSHAAMAKPPALGKLAILLQLLFSFLAGGVIGAFGYGYFGFNFSIVLASLLLALSLPVLRWGRIR